MPRFYASAVVWITLTLVASCFGPDWVFAASPADATDAPEMAVPQGADPPGADNGDQPHELIAMRVGPLLGER